MNAGMRPGYITYIEWERMMENFKASDALTAPDAGEIFECPNSLEEHTNDMAK